MTTQPKPRKGVQGSPPSDATRCTGITKTGTRCTRTATRNGCCQFHARATERPKVETPAPDTLEKLRTYLADALIRAVGMDRYGDAAKLAQVQIDVINLLDNGPDGDFDGMDAEAIQATIEAVEKRLGN